ncbi:MAG TPA: sugar-binding transcriptional regulator [Firmicutes bacterium]|nr:sugar-binding transcriptional regulator [Bacillota bacterium]
MVESGLEDRLEAGDRLTGDRLTIVEIARLYYEEGKTQEDIAKEMGISRSTVSRSLKKARKIGAVQIRVVDPCFECTSIARELEARYGLRRAIVVPSVDTAGAVSAAEAEGLIKRDIGRAAAEYLSRVMRDGDILSTAWGSTLYEVAKALTPARPVKVRIVQLAGFVGNVAAHEQAGDLARRIASAFGGEWYLLPAPLVVENKTTRDAILHEPAISQVLGMARQASVALVGIGTCDASSLMVRAGYLREEDLKELGARGAVGDVCYRYYDEDGNPCPSEWDDRVIAITLQELRDIPLRVGAAGGERKIKAIRSALKGGYINVLITDETAARGLLA